MAEDPEWKIDSSDVAVLRGLAQRVIGLSRREENQERREAWTSLNSLHMQRPMIMTEIGGLLQSGELDFSSLLQCHEKWARDVEHSLRCTIYEQEQVGDDTVVEPWFNINWQVTIGDFGVEVKKHSGSTPGHMGSYVWEPPIKDLKADLGKLHPRPCQVNREATLAWKTHLDKVIGDILPVRIRGGFWWSTGLTWAAIDLIGLEQLMLFMYDDPEGLHRLMAFLRDDQLAVVRWLEREQLLSLNNENDYIGSGSRGHCRELPRNDWQPGSPVRLKDLWVLSESQETVGVGPEMFDEFVFQYQLPIVQEFGLSYYGCCEPVHSRWHVIQRLPNLRKVSVSPWCDEALMAHALGGKYVYCRKPNPAMVSTETFDEELIKASLRKTLSLTRPHGCQVELVMKDVHTLANQPWRLHRWVELAREVCREFA